MKKTNRRDFLKLTGLAAGSLMLAPLFRIEPAPLDEVRLPAPAAGKPRLRDLAEKLGIEIGASLRTIDRWKLYQYPEYLDSIRQFSLVKDGYTSSPDSWMNDTVVYEYLVQLGRFTKKNDMGMSIDQLFDWSWFRPPHLSASLKDATKEELDAFLQEMVRKHFELPYFTDLIFASEPTGSDTDDVPYWNASPLLRIYGEEWPEMAYRLAWEEAGRTGRKVGENLSFVYQAAGQVEVPHSRHAAYELEHLARLRQKLADTYGIERPFSIGLEYHINFGSQSRIGSCWGPSAAKLKKAELIEHFQRFDEIGDMMINESSLTVTAQPEQKLEMLHTLLEAAIESKAVKRILFWTPFFQSTGDAGEDAKERTCVTTGFFKEDYTPDYLFEEMYKIFEGYGK